MGYLRDFNARPYPSLSAEAADGIEELDEKLRAHRQGRFY